MNTALPGRTRTALGTSGYGTGNLSPLQEAGKELCNSYLFGYVTTEYVIIRYVVISWFQRIVFITFNTMFLCIYFLTTILWANWINIIWKIGFEEYTVYSLYIEGLDQR